MNSYGRIFRLSIFGESHGPAVGILIDGCPAGLELSQDDFLGDLERRKGGGAGKTGRVESDLPYLESGFWKGRTTGAPLLIRFANEDVRSGDYADFKRIPRPGHADFCAANKFGGWQDARGGGHFSGRLTLGLVAAGVIAKKMIRPVMVSARLVEAGGEEDPSRAVERAASDGDSVGGLIECEVLPVPVGLGEPFFDSVESLLAHLLFSIPAVKGVEFGAGFKSARMRGSECNDVLEDVEGRTATNHSGGINGGLTNGNPVRLRAAVKPTSSIPRVQKTVHLETGKPVDLRIGGRHDTCIALRMPVIVEAATAIVFADLLLQEQKIGRIVPA